MPDVASAEADNCSARPAAGVTSLRLKLALASAVAVAVPFIWIGHAAAQGCSCG